MTRYFAVLFQGRDKEIKIRVRVPAVEVNEWLHVICKEDFTSLCVLPQTKKNVKKLKQLI